MTFSEFAHKLISFAFDHFQIVVSLLSPLLRHLALELFSLSSILVGSHTRNQLKCDELSPHSIRGGDS